MIKKILRRINRARIKLGERGFKIPIPNKILNIAETKIPEFVYVDDNKIFLERKGTVSTTLFYTGIWEENETNLVKKEIQKDDIVLDIGAHIGYYTLLFAKLAGPGGKIFAFEPDRGNYNLLKKNIKENGYQNITIERMAVSDENGTTKLFLSENDSGHNRIYYGKYVSKNFDIIKKINLDDYFKNDSIAEKISFVKMDVEGSELGVLRGMKSILNKNNKLKILLEFSPSQMKEFGTEPSELLKLLKTYDFNFYRIKSNGVIPTTEDSLLKDQHDLMDTIFCKRN